MSLHLRRVADDNAMAEERGTYRRIYDYWTDYCTKFGKQNTHWAEICCPGCGRGAMIGSNHTVDENGVVTPSVVCPFAPCTFHSHVILDDWARPSTPRRERQP